MSSVELSGGGKLIECRACGKFFPFYPERYPSGYYTPKTCPRCVDVRDQRPSVVERREELARYENVEVVSLPRRDWHLVQGSTRDHPVYRMVLKGGAYGSSWSGRIDLFAPERIQTGQPVDIIEMESSHRVKVRQYRKETLHHGTVLREELLPITSDAEDAEDTILERRYLYLEPAPTTAEAPSAWLVFAEAHTKTTLKGFGLQYRARATGSPIAEWRATGGMRSGRESTTGVLAIVDREHPLIIEGTGDRKFTAVYPPEAIVVDIE